MKINELFQIDLNAGIIEGAKRWERRLSEMSEAFCDKKAVEKLLCTGDPLIYEVYEVDGVPEKVGELLWSTTILYPGKIGNEYFMTKGHYHLDPSCAEVYLVLLGEGFLLIKDKTGARALPVKRGTVAYVPPGSAHRMVNIGAGPLVFFAVYPAQAGHDYERVRQEGFGLRVFHGNKGPEVCYTL